MRAEEFLLIVCAVMLIVFGIVASANADTRTQVFDATLSEGEHYELVENHYLMDMNADSVARMPEVCQSVFSVLIGHPESIAFQNSDRGRYCALSYHDLSLQNSR